MRRIETKNGTAYVCEICGLAHCSKSFMERHEKIPRDHTPDLSEGSVLEHKGERWTLTNFYYSQKPEPLINPISKWIDGPHQLVLVLKQTHLHGSKSPIPYDANLEGVESQLWITYAEYLLWKEGDVEKLIAAGLTRKPLEKRPGFFRRMLSTLGT